MRNTILSAVVVVAFASSAFASGSSPVRPPKPKKVKNPKPPAALVVETNHLVAPTHH